MKKPAAWSPIGQEGFVKTRLVSADNAGLNTVTSEETAGGSMEEELCFF